MVVPILLYPFFVGTVGTGHDQFLEGCLREVLLTEHDNLDRHATGWQRRVSARTVSTMNLGQLMGWSPEALQMHVQVGALRNPGKKGIAVV